MTAGESPRGITLPDHRFITQSVRHAYDANAGILDTILDLEGEGILLPAVAMRFPGTDDPEPQPPDEPPEPPIIPDVPPLPEELSDTDAVVTTGSDVRSSVDIDQASPTWTTELA